MNIFNKTIRAEKKFKKVAEEQLDENVVIMESLRDYDEGKKHISTSKLETRLPNIRVTSGA
ncbi:MAG: hypothetical protein AAB917_00980 [Patescibacteria group bacterium]